MRPMNNFLTGLAALSLGSVIAIGLMALIRHFTLSRYAAKWRCLVWLVLCLRLLIPFSLRSASARPPISIPVPENMVVYQQEGELPEQAVSVVLPGTVPEAEEQIEVHSASPAVRLYDVLGIIWITGAAAVILWAALSHIRFCSYLRRWGQPVTDESTLQIYGELTGKMKLRKPPKLRVCAGLAAPMLSGIFRNSILLPETDMDGPSLQHTLIHELTHYRRKDIWLKTLSLLARAIHWFNPMVWYLSHLISQDTELACDQDLLRFLPKEEYTAYCSTILNSVNQIKTKGEQK